MKKFIEKLKKRNVVVFLFLGLLYFGNVMFTSQRASHQVAITRMDNNNKFVGSASCAACHNEIYKSHIKTAHYLTSRPAAKEFIKGSFVPDKNLFVYSKFIEVSMQRKKDRFYQVEYISGEESQRQPFDIVIGSGRKGQTYLYWIDSSLFQLPISYYTPTNSWCNSPGFPTNSPKFDREIPAMCMECHGTYAKAEDYSDGTTTYEKNQIMYGVDCERCHGPGSEHVTFQSSHPTEKAKYIINAKSLNRQQRLDGCALCHSGFRTAKQPAFSFMVGDKLEEFSTANYSADSASVLDVHGNQSGLLTASKCFKMSEQMDCSSCHDVHKNEFNSAKIFSQKCMSCHNETSHNTCTMPATKGLVLSNNCIECHMPSLPSAKILLEFSNSQKALPDLVRTHRIAIYEQKTKEFLKKINN